ncbi:MAG: pentapeptide repeat-containing protein [Bacteriovoracaceae bacterium]|nr:pentapeptide repeat-containing protein [Bacteriovoracaceae bacterium]
MTNYFDGERFDDLTSLPANLDEVEFLGCEFIGLDLSEISLRGAKFIECNFLKCNLSNCNITNASLRDIEFKSCKLLGVNWGSAKSFFDLKVCDSNLDYCIFNNTNIQGALFKGSMLRHCEFAEAKICKATFDDCDLEAALFHHTNLEQADFREARNYFIDVSNNRVKGALFSLPGALSLFSPLGIIIE